MGTAVRTARLIKAANGVIVIRRMATAEKTTITVEPAANWLMVSVPASQLTQNAVPGMVGPVLAPGSETAALLMDIVEAPDLIVDRAARKVLPAVV
jgi:hypothetical protein